MSMRLFVDTSYWLALLDPVDLLHRKAVALEGQFLHRRLSTTNLVLVELLNSFSRRHAGLRRDAVELVDQILSAKRVVVSFIDHGIFSAATSI